MKTIIFVVVCNLLFIGTLAFPVDDSYSTDLRVGETDTVPLVGVESIASPLNVETKKSDEVGDDHTLLKRAVAPELSFEERTPARGGGGGGGGGGYHGHGHNNHGHNYHGGHGGGHKKSHGGGGHRW